MNPDETQNPHMVADLTSDMQDDQVLCSSNSIVLNISVKFNDRYTSVITRTSVLDNFRDMALNEIAKYNGILSSALADNIMAIFVPEQTSDILLTPELAAVECAHHIREILLKRDNEDFTRLQIRACINGGQVLLDKKEGSMGERGASGSGVSASYLVLDTTSPMQITITRKVKEKVKDHFHFVQRNPTTVGFKTAMLFYLHTPIEEKLGVEI